jgi:hypothetical protein
MLVIVGHGPSVLSGLGSVIDSHTVVRLKEGLRVKPKPDPRHFGTRTDYLCGRSKIYEVGKTPFWHFNDPPEWMRYYASFNPRHPKPTSGLCAVFCAIDKVAPDEIGLIGFDRLLDPSDMKSRKWHEQRSRSMYGHDQRAEHEALMNLPLRIIDLARKHGPVC